MSEQLDLWKEEKSGEEVTTAELDQAITYLRVAKDEYQSKKLVSDEAYARVKDRESTLFKLMEKAGKDKYICEGVGRVSISTKMSVKVPKSPEEKQAFFNWIREHEGEDAYHAYMTVNSNTLNSFFNRKNEEYAERGEILNIDGLEQPTEYKKLSLTKA
jgi:hypothetical protein